MARRADSGVLPYERVDNTVKLKRFWNGIDYMKFINEINERLRLLRNLHEIYPKLELQAEALDGWRTKLFNFDEHEFYAELRAPAVHYRLLPNEIVFEIDCENLTKARDEAMKITKRLITLGARPLVGFSGRRGYHIHLLIAPPDGDVFNFANSLGVKEFTLELFEVLKGLTEANQDYLDTGVMEYTHTIRAFYSLHTETRRFKKPVFGKEGYSIWTLPRSLWNRVMNQLRERIETQEILKELSAFDEPRVKIRSGGKKYKWIKYILEHPEKIHDGRARLLWLAIVPYLVLQGYSDARIEEICQKWVEKTGEEWKSKYRCKVNAMLKYCREFEKNQGQKWMPITLERLIENFSDLAWLKEVIEN